MPAWSATPPEPTWLYILRCADGRYYVGTTRRTPEERVGEHNAGVPGSYTIRRRPVRLAWAQDFQWATDAIDAERRIKRWSRAKKEALMRGDWDALRALARKDFGKRGSLDTAASRPTRDEVSLDKPAARTTRDGG